MRCQIVDAVARLSKLSTGRGSVVGSSSTNTDGCKPMVIKDGAFEMKHFEARRRVDEVLAR